MALKKKITKAEFDKLSDTMKGEYIADGEGFKLDLTDDEDTGPLKRALEREKANAATSKARLAEIEAELESLRGNDARKNGDIATLEKQWEKKHGETTAQFEARIAKLQGFANKTLLDNAASQMAAKIFGPNAAIGMPHIKNRLTVEFEGDEPNLKILDSSGKASAMKLEDLEKEISGNKDFAAIIVGSKATGSGASKDGRQKQSSGAQNDDGSKKLLSQMNPRELADHIKASKESQQT